MERKIIAKEKGRPTVDGAGVSLVRVLGRHTAEEFDPILLLDSFDTTNPDDFTAGFPMHPHRGIETVSYVFKGGMVHKDSLGNEDEVSDGGIQWMNSGSGIMHEEKIPPADRLLGVQLWLNLPKAEKMSDPYYHAVRSKEIEEIPFDGGHIRLLAGSYDGHEGFKARHLSLNYYDITFEKESEITLEMEKDDSVTLFTLLGQVYVNRDLVEEKTAVKLSEGDRLTLKKTGDDLTKVLYFGSRPLNEPIAWAGSIVMNTQLELREASHDLRNGNFVRVTEMNFED